MAITHRIEANLSGSTTADQVFDEALTDFDAVTPAWDGEADFEENDLTDFDSTADVGGKLASAASAKHDGSYGMEVTYDTANQVSYGSLDLTAINQSSAFTSFWFDPNSVVCGNSIGFQVARFADGAGTPIGMAIVQNNGTNYDIQWYYTDDTALQFLGTSQLSDSWHKLGMYVKISSGAGNNDGKFLVYTDNQLSFSKLDIDNDTLDIDNCGYGCVYAYANAGQFGSFYIDSIYLDTVGAPMLDTLAAQNGTYGISIPVMDATERTVSFTDPTAETAITAECNLDINSLTIGEGEQNYPISFGHARLMLYYHAAYGYRLRLINIGDTATTYSDLVVMTDAPHKLRLVWQASSAAGADDGYMKLYVDDVLAITHDGLDDDTKSVDLVAFGGSALDAGTYGIFYMDDCRWSPFVEITKDVIGDITGHWGFQKDDPSVFIADSGVFNFTMNNTSGIYTPGLTTSLAGWDKGTPIRISFYDDGVSRRKIYGTINDFDISKEPFSNKKIRVIVGDWFDYAATHPMISPAIETLQRGDEMLDTILADMPIQPQNTEFSTGSNIFETAFDTVKFNSKAYSEMSKVAVSELGPIYTIKDPVYGETLVFESAWDRNGLRESVVTVDNNMTSLEVSYGENIINRFINIANPRYIEAGIKVLYALGSPVRIGIGETITLRGNYTDPSGGAAAVGANMINPVITTDYLMNSEKDGGGTNRSADLNISVTYGAAGVVYELTNNSIDLCWITKLQARGYLVYKYNIVEQAAEDTDSQTDKGIFEKKIDQKYQKDPYIGYQYGRQIIARENDSRLKVERINFIANRSDALMDMWLDNDVGDMIRLKDDTKEIDDYFYIHGIQFSISEEGLVKFSWIVTLAACSLLLGCLSPVEAEFDGEDGSVLDFGYVHALSGDAATKRTVSLWANYDDLGAGGNYNSLFSDYVGEGGTDFTTYYDGANWVINVFIDRYTVNYGDYVSTAVDPFTIGADHHFLYKVDIEDPWATVEIWIDGVNIPLTQSAVAAGAVKSAEGIPLAIGNSYWAAGVVDPLTSPADATIWNIKAYDVLLTNAEIATLAADGEVTRGKIFQSPCVKTEELDYYEDHVMIAGDRVLDDMYGAIGTAAGSVTIRLP